jgi:positive regulator of sigma E activity
MLPSLRSVTRFSGRGRSSVESQKSTACSATLSSVHCGASLVCRGFSPRYISALDLPTIWMLPSG